MTSKMLIILGIVSLVVMVVAGTSDDFDVETLDEEFKRDPELLAVFEEMAKRGKSRKIPM